ncbi:MAG: hypothetical protein LBJ67_11235 [Planctomycetaceae bacterium]|jgi:hypothetical protein|nr:hypothetical protein [Planctomycetaceae bacterium]
MEQNGGVHVRTFADGFWSGWGYIPYVLYGSGATFWLTSSEVESYGLLLHPNKTRINVKKNNLSMSQQIVDMRGGRNSLYASLHPAVCTTNMKSTGTAGYVDYRIPDSSVYATVTYYGMGLFYSVCKPRHANDNKFACHFKQCPCRKRRDACFQ